MVIFIVPDQINQIICLFQVLVVNSESAFCVSKDFFVIESAFQKRKKNTNTWAQFLAAAKKQFIFVVFFFQ